MAPELAQLAAPGEQPGDAIDAVAGLRNTIHGEALRGIRYSSASNGAAEHLVQVPPDSVEPLKNVAARRGGFDRWGIRELAPYALFFEADRLVDVLISETAEALSALMRATDVLRLPNVDPTTLWMGPPNDRAEWFSEFSPDALQAIRCLAGL